MKGRSPSISLRKKLKAQRENQSLKREINYDNQLAQLQLFWDNWVDQSKRYTNMSCVAQFEGGKTYCPWFLEILCQQEYREKLVPLRRGTDSSHQSWVISYLFLLPVVYSTKEKLVFKPKSTCWWFSCTTVQKWELNQNINSVDTEITQK